MKQLRLWIFRLLGIYAAIVVLTFLFAIGSQHYSILANLEKKLNPSEFVFWQAGELYSNPPLFSETMEDTKNQLSSQEPEDFSDVDIWVFLLEEFKDIHNVDFAPQLGIDVADVATIDPGSRTSIQRAGIRIRLHPIPFYVSRQHILIVDAKYLRENYETSCLDEMVYSSMIAQDDQALWDRCELS